MSSRRKSRIERGPAPRKADKSIRILTENTYRKYSRKAIERDFEGRCAFSMIHRNKAGGGKGIQIDHFNPTLKGRSRHAYKNLFPSAASCNNKKSNRWPNDAESKKGMRFLNPCEEHDYDEHIFEEPETGYLVATTLAGFYQITYMGLNDSHFVHNRLERKNLIERLENNNLFALDNPNTPSNELENIKKILTALNEAKDYAILNIQAPPQGVTLYRTHKI